MKKYTHPSVVKLFQTIQEYVPILEEGTSRGADPIHYQKGEITLDAQVGKYVIEVNTFWGTEIKIGRLLQRKVHGLKNTPVWLADFYEDREYNGKMNGYQGVVYQRHKGTGGLKLVYDLLKWCQKNEINYADQRREEMENYEPDPMGCLSDYE